ncbi:MAG: hypothetical protein ACFFHD_08055 [Promethearchaeota archaeon]
MGYNIESLSTLNKQTVELIKKAGIDTIEKLAMKKVDDLVKINGITILTAVSCIQEAIEFLNDIEIEYAENLANKSINPTKVDKSNLKTTHQKKEQAKTAESIQTTVKKAEIGYLKDIFTEEIISRIRFLHFKIKNLEEILNKQAKIVSIDDLDLILEYIDLLNINYKFKNQSLVIKELDITSSYFDPIDNEEINIYDVMFECARVSWVLARIYAQISKDSEKVEDLENAIIAMVKCSKMYKTATYFSAAAVNQNKIGKSLEPKSLEFESEQSRIFAQSLAAIKEEGQNNLIFASKLYAGLSLLSRRMSYLGLDNEKTKKQLSAQADFDMGKACYLKAQALQEMEIFESPHEKPQNKIVENLLKKAVYYFTNSEEIWEDMVKKFKDLKEKEKGNILFNLSVVNDTIMEIDAELLPYEALKDIIDPEPFVAVPENLADIIPRTTLYLSNIKPMDVNVEIFRKYKKEKLDKPNPQKKRQKLLSKKAAIGRMIKELKRLYDNNDIEINKYMELYEKYNIQFNNIDLEIQKLEGPINHSNKNKK